MSDEDDMARRYRKQDATYWKRTGTSSGGRPTYGSPINVKVRWEDKAEIFIGANNEQVTSKSIVLVDRDMFITDLLRLGTTATLPPGLEPEKVPGAYEIQAWQKTPNSRATKWLRRAVL